MRRSQPNRARGDSDACEVLVERLIQVSESRQPERAGSRDGRVADERAWRAADAREAERLLGPKVCNVVVPLNRHDASARRVELPSEVAIPRVDDEHTADLRELRVAAFRGQRNGTQRAVGERNSNDAVLPAQLVRWNLSEVPDDRKERVLVRHYDVSEGAGQVFVRPAHVFWLGSELKRRDGRRRLVDDVEVPFGNDSDNAWRLAVERRGDSKMNDVANRLTLSPDDGELIRARRQQPGRLRVCGAGNGGEQQA